MPFRFDYSDEECLDLLQEVLSGDESHINDFKDAFIDGKEDSNNLIWSDGERNTLNGLAKH